jgi:hypothetical protein
LWFLWPIFEYLPHHILDSLHILCIIRNVSDSCVGYSMSFWMKAVLIITWGFWAVAVDTNVVYSTSKENVGIQHSLMKMASANNQNPDSRHELLHTMHQLLIVNLGWFTVRENIEEIWRSPDLKNKLNINWIFSESSVLLYMLILLCCEKQIYQSVI